MKFFILFCTHKTSLTLPLFIELLYQAKKMSSHAFVCDSVRFIYFDIPNVPNAHSINCLKKLLVGMMEIGIYLQSNLY